jgi:hypothetical protein
MFATSSSYSGDKSKRNRFSKLNVKTVTLSVVVSLATLVVILLLTQQENSLIDGVFRFFRKDPKQPASTGAESGKENDNDYDAGKTGSEPGSGSEPNLLEEGDSKNKAHPKSKTLGKGDKTEEATIADDKLTGAEGIQLRTLRRSSEVEANGDIAAITKRFETQTLNLNKETKSGESDHEQDQESDSAGDGDTKNGSRNSKAQRQQILITKMKDALDHEQYEQTAQFADAALAISQRCSYCRLYKGWSLVRGGLSFYSKLIQ